MANRSRQTFIKRQKERARQEKQRQKAERRVQRNTDRVKVEGEGDEDPDIAGVTLGPQKPAWELMDVLTDDEVQAIADAEEAAKKEAEKKAAEA